MRIGIDISPVIYETGVSYYTRNLVKALIKLNKQDEFVLFGSSLRRKPELDNFVNAIKQRNVTGKTYYLPPTFLKFLWNDMHILNAELFTGNIDVFHSSDWAQAATKAYKVTTIHDLVPLRFPEISHPKVVSAHKARLRWVKKEVDRIIAVSEFTKKEIVELLQIEPERIIVIPEAADPGVKPASKQEVTRIKNRHGIRGEYLLVVGADPRKNIPAIIQAYRILRTQAELVIVGRPREEIPKFAGLRLLSHVSREHMPALYTGAQALVYTSLYEGFGLPILEAMQAGCPVVTSNISSMPEVAADAAILVDPTNPQEIADGIEEVLSDRKKWIAKGEKRAGVFSWEKAARATLNVYREAS